MRSRILLECRSETIEDVSFVIYRNIRVIFPGPRNGLRYKLEASYDPRKISLEHFESRRKTET